MGLGMSESNTAMQIDYTPSLTIETPIAKTVPVPGYPNLRKWSPGVSGNPAGRPALKVCIDKDLPTEEQSKRLVHLATQDDNLGVALSALKEAMDRVHGKVPERIDVRKTQISFDINDVGQGLEMIRALRDQVNGCGIPVDNSVNGDTPNDIK